MNSKAKGTRAERRAIRILETAGYICTKAGGSLGLFDVIAIGRVDVRAVQVKWIGALFIRLSNASRSSRWLFRRTCPRKSGGFDRAREPLIERL